MCSKNKLFMVSLFIAFLLGAYLFSQILFGVTTMAHEFAHKKVGESYGLHPIYKPSLNDFKIHLLPAQQATTNFPQEDWLKLKNGSNQMKADIALAGVRSDIKFLILFSSMNFILTFINLGIILLYHFKRSEKVLFLLFIVLFLQLIISIWLMMELKGSLPYDVLPEFGGDYSRLLSLL